LNYKIDDAGRVLRRVEVMKGYWKEPALTRCGVTQKAAGSSFRGNLTHNRHTASEQGELAATMVVGADKEG
jgi:hypothetical protein